MRRLRLKRAIAFAVDSPRRAVEQTVRSAPTGAAPNLAGVLTSREQVVARLVAKGRSNREIAEALVIAERTAEAHVTHILTKLGLRSRSQVAIWALEHDVVPTHII